MSTEKILSAYESLAASYNAFPFFMRLRAVRKNVV